MLSRAFADGAINEIAYKSKLKILKKEEIDLLKRVHNIDPVELGEIVSLGIQIKLIKEALNNGSSLGNDLGIFNEMEDQKTPINSNVPEKPCSEFLPDKIISEDDTFLNGLTDILLKNMVTPSNTAEADPRKRHEAIIKNRRAILQLFDIKVLVYPERVEIKGIVPSQVIDKASEKEPVTAPIISSPSPYQGEGEERMRGLRPLKLAL